jgi:hypothetical protein
MFEDKEVICYMLQAPATFYIYDSIPKHDGGVESQGETKRSRNQ